MVIASDILTPADRDEAAVIVASERQEHFWLSGSQTAVPAAAAHAGAAVLGSHRISKVIEYDPADLTVTVEAGCLLGALQEVLAGGGQFLPVDYPPSGTVGGLIATAATGPRALGYGAVRDRLLGVTAITPSGEVTRSGSRVVKSVAGFNLPRLYCGSFGTLAFIVEATFKVSPLPEQRATLAFQGDLADLATFAERLLGSYLRPTWMVATAESLPDPPPRPVASSHLVVGLEGSEPRVTRLAKEVRGLASASGLAERAAEEPVAESTAQHLTLHLSPAAARRFFAAPPLPGKLTADLGTGQVTLQPHEPPTDRDVSSLEEWLELGDSMTVAWAGFLLRRRLDPGTACLIRRLKSGFDPRDRFNRGLLEQLL
jgi:FAD/FMN-containing dehydrogenase